MTGAWLIVVYFVVVWTYCISSTRKEELTEIDPMMHAENVVVLDSPMGVEASYKGNDTVLILGCELGVNTVGNYLSIRIKITAANILAGLVGKVGRCKDTLDAFDGLYHTCGLDIKSWCSPGILHREAYVERLPYYSNTGGRIGTHGYLHPSPLSQDSLPVRSVENDLRLSDAVFHGRSNSVTSSNDFIGLGASISHFVPLKTGSYSYNDSKKSNGFVRPFGFFPPSAGFFPPSAKVWKWIQLVVGAVLFALGFLWLLISTRLVEVKVGRGVITGISAIILIFIGGWMIYQNEPVLNEKPYLVSGTL